MAERLTFWGTNGRTVHIFGYKWPNGSHFWAQMAEGFTLLSANGRTVQTLNANGRTVHIWGYKWPNVSHFWAQMVERFTLFRRLPTDRLL